MAEQAYLLNQLKILTLNCQGLRNKRKCRYVFDYLKQKNHYVYFLQDTHLTPNEENQIQTLWVYKAYFNLYASNSRGVAMLIKNRGGFALIIFSHWMVLYRILVRAEWVRNGLFGPGCIICNEEMWSSICFWYLLFQGIVYHGFEMYS